MVSKYADGKMYRERRDLLRQAILKAHPDKTGCVVLFAGFENPRCSFVQESSFYYYTGVTEPGVVLLMREDGSTVLYVPNFGIERLKWVTDALVPGDVTAQRVGVDFCEPLGDASKGYCIHPYVDLGVYSTLLKELTTQVGRGQKMFFCQGGEGGTRCLFDRLCAVQPDIAKAVVNVAPLVARQRRSKTHDEIELLYAATGITSEAHQAAAFGCVPGVTENEVRARVEYIFTAAGAGCAFPTIVGSGDNSTVLHHTAGQKPLKKGELVVVDCGALCEHYGADLSRTYPVGGIFSKRQREVYQVVLDTQAYVASIAKPGFWLHNAEQTDKSLHHLAKEFLAKHGFAEYMTHGIGHFLGLDVHDVGDHAEPLAEGDVFTIEPGIYLPKEGFGIRIEDDYWMVRDGVECLSYELPKDPDEIQTFMQERE